MEYECWKTEEGSISFFPADTEQRALVAPKGSTFQYSIHAESWEEAMTQHHEKQGWEPYRPF